MGTSTFIASIKKYQIPLLVSGVYYAVFLFLNFWGKEVDFWGIYFPNMLPEKTYVCEHLFEKSVIKQPLSTVTNVLYLFFAVHVFLLSRSDKRAGEVKPNLMRSNRRLSVCFSFCLIMLTFGSTFYHMSVSHLAYIFDMTGVFLVSIFLILYNVLKIINLKWHKDYGQKTLEMVLFYFVLILLVAVCLIFFLDSELIIAFLAGTLVVTSFYFEFAFNKRSKTRLLYGGILSGAIATSFFYLDWVYCNEYSYFQGHSTWHLVSAFSMMAFYFYFRSEKYME